MHIIDTIFQIFTEQGGAAYIGEPVTQLEHALQAAMAAQRHRARATVITAALLHDIGHLLHDHPENCAELNIDSQHEKIGAEFLQEHFDLEVTELIKNHVNAKRYLCATNSKYFASLTPASRHSLELQGGPMNAAEMDAFAVHPLLSEIILLRRWDEAAKIPNKILPPITEFYPILQASLRAFERNPTQQHPI